MKLKPYPLWCCYDCGMKARNTQGLDEPIGTATYHIDVCEVCLETKEVTEPRDFGSPLFDGHW